MPPVEIDLRWDTLVVRPTGWHRVWSLRRAIVVPYEQIVSVEHDPAFARRGAEGARLPGSHIGNRYHAGTFLKYWVQPKVRSFWVRGDPDRTILLRLRGHRFDLICVEVDDPHAQVARIRAAVADSTAPG